MFKYLRDLVKYLIRLDAPIPAAIQTAGAITSKRRIITPLIY